MAVEPAPLPISSRWLDHPDELRRDFHAGKPFPILVLDDFFEPDFARALHDAFPPVDAMPKSRDYLFADKHELSSLEEQGGAPARFHAMATSPPFASFLVAATGFEGLFVDPLFQGGGFHQGADGSYLDMHVDFNLHPLHKTWLRTLNLLLYLNLEWQDEYGGQLLVKSRPDEDPRSIAPLFNRMVIQLTDAHTFHGYRRMRLPSGVTRKSIATYAYREIDEGAVAPRTTGWVPEDAGSVKRFVARHYNTLVQLKNRWLGSGTAGNR